MGFIASIAHTSRMQILLHCPFTPPWCEDMQAADECVRFYSNFAVNVMFLNYIVADVGVAKAIG